MRAVYSWTNLASKMQQHTLSIIKGSHLELFLPVWVTNSANSKRREVLQQITKNK